MKEEFSLNMNSNHNLFENRILKIISSENYYKNFIM